MKRCIRCKTINEDDALYCQACCFNVFERYRKPGKLTAIGKCVLYIAAYFILQIILSVAISLGVTLYQMLVNGIEPTEEMIYSLTLWISDISNILFLIGLLIFLKARKKKFTSEVRIRKFKPWVVPLCIALGFCSNIALSVMSYFIPWPAEWIEAYSESTLSLIGDNIWINIASICILTGIAEEILFRGILMTRLRRAFGPVLTVILSSAIFAVVHLTPTSMVPIFVFAIFLGAVFLKYDSVIPTIIMHASFNLAALVPFPESTLLIFGEAFICLSVFILTAYLLLRKQISKEAVEI